MFLVKLVAAFIVLVFVLDELTLIEVVVADGVAVASF